MEGHKERLIAADLLEPMAGSRVSERNGILFRIAQGEEIKEKPIFCVYRRDELYNHVVASPKHICKDAELIADRLYSYEAYRLCDRLNARDEEQPRTGNGLWYLDMYAICTMEDWANWEMKTAQIPMEGVADGQL